MKQFGRAALAAAFLFSNLYPALSASDLECAKIKERIREIQSKMRSGYTRAQGEKMEAELRKLRVLRSKACR